MSELSDLIDKIVNKQTTVEEALPEFQKVLVTSDDRSATPTFDETAKRAMEDDNDYDNTFSEVISAWISGRLTDQQFGALRAAVTPGGNSGEVADDPIPKSQKPAPAKKPAPATPKLVVPPK